MKKLNKIEGTVARYEAHLKKLNTELDNLPKDTICAHKRGEHFIYCVRHVDAKGKRHEKYLPSNDVKEIAEYCQAAYLRKLIPSLQKEAKSLYNFKRSYDPQAKFDAWNKLPEAYKKFAKQYYKSNEEICHEWENADFNTNDFPMAGGSRYITKKGELVRSRIELIVANILYDLKIPYRYECELRLKGGTIYPDFTIMHPETLEVYYLEIFGMMDNSEYEMSAFKKIAKYSASEYYSNLIMFFDHKNAPISPEDIKRTLEKLFC